MNVFDTIQGPPPKYDPNYQPPELPSLTGVDDIIINFETDGLKWWRGNLPVGFGLGLPGRDFRYFGVRHTGGNICEATAKRWFQREVRGKRITNINTRFDIHMAREWGVDFEAQGNTVTDVSHWAALLDDHRMRFSLDTLIGDMLPGGVRVPRLDESRMKHYHAAEEAARGAYQCEAVNDLAEVMYPKLVAENLLEVKALEDDVIYVVCEMEKNGALLDVDLLDRWLIDSERQLEAILYELSREIGKKTQERLFEGGKAANLFSPKNAGDMETLFKKLGLPLTMTASGKQASFAADILKPIKHPTIEKVKKANRLINNRTKFLIPYANSVDRKTGILRYALHQLKAEKDEWSEGAAGTVSGRFSSTKPADDEGMNIQQIIKTAKQRIAWGFDENDDSHDHEIFPIRQLHIPASGQFLSADAMQIEYRVFAAKSKSKRLIGAYFAEPLKDENGDWVQGPLLSFHRLMHRIMRAYVPDMPYRRAKDINFAKIYGAGLRKMALMMGIITQEQYFKLLDDTSWRRSPLLADVIKLNEVYNTEIPEAAELLSRAQSLAENRGYVKTITGRRSRFPGGARSHKALNAVIQGSAADINKKKLVELHKERAYTGLLLRYTVHDEVDGDSTQDYTAERVGEILNRQSYPSAVPILWDVSVGPTWKACA